MYSIIFVKDKLIGRKIIIILRKNYYFSIKTDQRNMFILMSVKKIYKMYIPSALFSQDRELNQKGLTRPMEQKSRIAPTKPLD